MQPFAACIHRPAHFRQTQSGGCEPLSLPPHPQRATLCNRKLPIFQKLIHRLSRYHPVNIVFRQNRLKIHRLKPHPKIGTKHKRLLPPRGFSCASLPPQQIRHPERPAGSRGTLQQQSARQNTLRHLLPGGQNLLRRVLPQELPMTGMKIDKNYNRFLSWSALPASMTNDPCW